MMHAAGRSLVSLLLASAVQAAALPCGAEDALRVAAAQELGVAWLPEAGGGLPSLDLSTSLRWHFLSFGAGGSWRTVVLVNSIQLHGTAGVVLPLIASFRCEALGLVGARHYPHWGHSLLGDDPGTDQTLAFAGTRVRLLYEIPVKHVQIHAGVALGYEDDLERRAVSYSYDSSAGWFGGDHSGRERVTHVVGTEHWLAAASVGGSFELR